MKPEQLFSLICLSFIQHLLINMGKGEIVSEGDSAYKFNFTWTPPVLKNGKNYTIDVFTEGKAIEIEKFKLCLSIKVDSLNQTFFDDCIDTTCDNVKDIISSLFQYLEVVDCPFRTTYIKANSTFDIDEWVPLIAGNFEVKFNMTLNNPNDKTIIRGIGNINAE